MFREWWPNFRLRFRALLNRRRLDRDLEDEIRFHLASRSDRHRADGVALPEAARRSRLEFGNPTAWKETCRDMWTFHWIETVVRDLRYAARSLWRTPAFTVVAILTLALGIGANTAIFSVARTVLFDPLPYPESDRLVMLWGNVRREAVERRGTSLADYADWRDQSTSFEAMALVTDSSATLGGIDDPERLRVEFVAHSYFDILGVRPALGRTFLPSEDEVAQRDRVVILTHGLWQRRFGGDPSIVGESILLDGRRFAVIGVMRPGFRGVTDGAHLWMPLHMVAPQIAFSSRGNRGPGVLARLKPGVSLARAQAEMDEICRRLEAAFPETNEARGVELSPLEVELFGRARAPLLVLMTAVGVVLLMACINVANLLLVRSEARRREMAVRAALGAGRLRVLLQLTTESGLLAFLGAAVGLFLAYWGIPVLMAVSPVAFPRYIDPGLDLRVALFALGLTGGIGLLVGLAPAVHALRSRVREAVQRSSRSVTGGRAGFRNALVVAEIAFATLLLIGAGLLMRSLRELSAIEPGFEASNVLTLRVMLPRLTDPQGVNPSTDAGTPASERAAVTVRGLLERLEQIPSVQSAAAGTDFPLRGGGSATFYEVEGAPPTTAENRPRIYFHFVTPNFFQTLQIPLLAGRTFSASEMDSGDVVVVSENVAWRFWPGQDPIGKRISLGTIVGVVGELKYRGLPDNPTADPDVFQPLRADQRGIAIAVRTGLDPALVAGAVRAAIMEAEPAAVIFDAAPLTEAIAQQTSRSRFTGWLMSMFAGVALLLATIGIYGVLAYAVSRRQQEFAVRIALGASRQGVVALVLRAGAVQIALGIGLGVAAAIVATRSIASLLYNVAPRDFETFVYATLILGLVAAAACLVPALRAGRVPPALALRGE